MLAFAAGPIPGECTLEPGPAECSRAELLKLYYLEREVRIESEVAFDKSLLIIESRDDEISGLHRIIEAERLARRAQAVSLPPEPPIVTGTCLAIAGAACLACGAGGVGIAAVVE